MQCPACGTPIREGQKFCMECGQSLRGISDVTGEVPAIVGRGPATTSEVSATQPAEPRTADQTQPVAPIPPPPPPVRAYPTSEEARADSTPTGVITTTPPLQPREVTGEYTAPEPRFAPEKAREHPGFRLRPLLVLALLAAVAAVAGVLSTLIEITTTTDQPPFETGIWKVNDFGTNNSVAALLAAGAMVVGALAWCFGYRWGAGLVGGAGAALAGWAALLLGLAELPVNEADAGASVAPAEITRDVGYWALAVAGVLGIVALLVSLVRAGNDRRAGLDPWVAALAAVAILAAAIGPTIPEGSADWSANYSSSSLGVDLPAAFFAGRLVQLGLLAFCGVVGFLLVRRYGLGLAVGGAISAGFMVATAATQRTASPIGPAYENPGSFDLKPHAVTTVGMALAGFFALVAIVMALLDAER